MLKVEAKNGGKTKMKLRMNHTQELWFREAYRDLIKHEALTLAVRPGDRHRPDPKGVAVGEIIRLRIILRPGSDEESREALLDEWARLAEVETIIVKPLGEVTVEELHGSSPDASRPELLPSHLALIYNRQFRREEPVTLIRFRYLPPETETGEADES